MPFSDYIGAEETVSSLRRILAADRLPQTLLFAGPRGIGKATLARYLAAAAMCTQRGAEGDFCGSCASCARVLAADLSLDEYRKMFAEREKAPAAKRGQEPLVVSTHPDYLIFPPDGPMRMISIEQARQLRKAAQFSPSEGRRRIFVIDQADRANSEAANSLLKTLEEPAPYLTLILTAENPRQLLSTIRSRSVPFYFGPHTSEDMLRFFEAHEEIPMVDRKRLASWAQGSPGRALAIDVEGYLVRRESMLALLRTALGKQPFSDALGLTESIARKQSEKLDALTETLRALLSDLLRLSHGGSAELINADIRDELAELATVATFDWIYRAAGSLDEVENLARRNIQKQIALEAWAVGLRRDAA